MVVSNWKVVLFDLDGERHVAGGFDARRAWSWFRYLYAWWHERAQYPDKVRLELWKGRKCLVALEVVGKRMACERSLLRN
jgi:hypothetical protein